MVSHEPFLSNHVAHEARKFEKQWSRPSGTPVFEVASSTTVQLVNGFTGHTVFSA